jgi:hypothetical protein
MAFIVWCQYIGPAIFLALYNTIFDTSLRSQLREQVPNVNVDAIIAIGATEFRKIVDARDLPGVLVAYSNSLDRVFYLVAAAAVVAWVSAWGMGWKDIRKTGAILHDQSAESSFKVKDENNKDNTNSQV